MQNNQSILPITETLSTLSAECIIYLNADRGGTGGRVNQTSFNDQILVS